MDLFGLEYRYFTGGAFYFRVEYVQAIGGVVHTFIVRRLSRFFKPFLSHLSSVGRQPHGHGFSPRAINRKR